MLPIRQFIPTYLRNIKPEKSVFLEFQRSLLTLFEETKKGITQGEEYQKGLLKEFIQGIFPKRSINTYKSCKWANIDLCVYDDDGDPEVIFESKAVSNSQEMIVSGSAQGLNKKALHEIILYYLDLKISQKINSIKYIIITNNIDWIIIDSVALDSITVHNAKVRKLYKNFDDQRNGLLKPKSSDFYEAIKRYFDDNPEHLLNLGDKSLSFKLTNQDISDIKKALLLYRVLNSDCLLKKRHTVSNVLDKGFYSELLYIIGLKEVEATQKIVRLEENERQNNSILEQVIELLKDKLGEVDDVQIFDIALELTITWLNRILFIKLLEAQLINWHPNNAEEYKILNKGLIVGYDWLNVLFFNVLAKPLSERHQRVEKFLNVPYLNSSLFEETQTEKKYGLTVANLIDGTINLFPQSILKKNQSSSVPVSGEMDGLDYLFRFLDSYDFGLDDADDLFTTHTKTIINPSVLGLIFEKINGYKDGSYFTPSHVTFYMAKSTITKAILDKLSFEFQQPFNSITEVANFIGLDRIKKQQVKTVIERLSVCDPAAGSGHFLVSALNVLFDIQFHLKLIFTNNGELLNNFVDINIEEDETNITDENGQLFVYNPHNRLSQCVQQTIFETKKRIIENSLFGVDINEKSVQICRLRLWIELLKYAYYRKEGDHDVLQTMPNIDINIKKGNSLVNRYELAIGKAAKSLPSDLNDAKKLIKEYRQAVKDYRNDANKLTKARLNKTIYDIKLLLGVNRQLVLDFGSEDAMKTTSNDAVLRQSFEWMLEFPEVLDDNGRFLGFDAILVNPPYIDSEAMKKHLLKERNYYKSKYETANGNWDIYIPFLERCHQLLSKNGYCSCITPDKWLTKDFGTSLRSYLSSHVLSVSRFGRDVFENAIVDAIVTEFSYKKSSTCIFGDYERGEIIELNQVKTSSLTSTYDYHFCNSETLDIGESLPLKVRSFAQCEGACATSDCYLLKDLVEDSSQESDKNYKLVNTGTLTKFGCLWGEKPIKYLGLKLLAPVVKKDVFKNKFGGKAYDTKTQSPKIIIKGLTKLDAMLDPIGEYIPGKSTVVVYSQDVKLLKVLLAFINSSFAIAYLHKRFPSATYNGGLTFTGDIIGAIPIPDLTDDMRSKILSDVDEIIAKGIGSNGERWATLDDYISSLYKWNKTMS